MKTDSDERTSLLSSDRPWWTVRQLAKEFQYSESTVRGLVEAGLSASR